MKKVFKIFILIVIIGGVYVYRAPLREKFLPVWNAVETSLFNKYLPCAKPIPYTLGTFDTKFNISKTYFLSAVKEAEDAWEQSISKDLFVYKPEGVGVLKINLIYDYRQESSSKLQNIGLSVKDDKASYDTLKIKFSALKIEYEKAQKDFNAQVQVFHAKQDAYEKEVQYWNKKGGAPKAEYDKLNAEQSSLAMEAKELQNMQIYNANSL